MGRVVFVSSGAIQLHAHRPPPAQHTIALIHPSHPGSVTAAMPPVQRLSSTSVLDRTRLSLLGHCGAGHYVGDLEYYRRSLSLARYIALGKCDLYGVSFSLLREVLYKHPTEEEEFLSDCHVRYLAFQKACLSVVESGSALNAPELQPGSFDGHLLWVNGRCKARKDAPEISLLTSTKHFLTRRLGKGGIREHREETKADLRRRMIIHPDGVSKSMWDIFVGAMVLYSILWTSSLLCFKVEVSFTMRFLDWLVDFFLFMDMLVSCRTAYFIETDAVESSSVNVEVLVTVQSDILHRYLRQWFLIDFLSVIPYDDLFQSNLTALRDLKILRMIRIFKLDKLKHVMSMVENMSTISIGAIEVLRMLGKIVFAAHFIACLWWLLGSVVSHSPWYSQLGLDPGPFQDKYAASLYWTITTLTTVGYGDIVPRNLGERVVACVVMMLGGMAFGYSVANMTSTLSQMDLAYAKANEKIDQVKLCLHLLGDSVSYHFLSISNHHSLQMI